MFRIRTTLVSAGFVRAQAQCCLCESTFLSTNVALRTFWYLNVLQRNVSLHVISVGMSEYQDREAFKSPLIVQYPCRAAYSSGNHLL
jgi:hypothetical protein